MKLINPMLALLASITALSAMADSNPSPSPDPNGGMGTPTPPQILSEYTVVDMGKLLGGTDAAALAIGNSGRAVGWANSCIGRGCSLIVSAVYWDVGQLATKIPMLPGMKSSKATGITDAGVIVGNSMDTSGHKHGWRWSAETGTTEMLSPNDGSSLIVTAAFANGWTTGYFYPPGKFGSHAFRYNLANGYFDDHLFPDCVRDLLVSLNLAGLIPSEYGSSGCLNDKDMVATEGYAVDLLGNVAGSLEIGNGQYKLAYLWPNGSSPIDLHAPGWPIGIDAQQATALFGTLFVIGPYVSGSGYRTFKWSLGTGLVEDMGLNDNVYPNAVSSYLRMVGFTTTGTQRPVTWNNNALSHLPVPTGLNYGNATGVNRCGNLVGAAQDANFKQHALRWTKANCD